MPFKKKDTDFTWQWERETDHLVKPRKRKKTEAYKRIYRQEYYQKNKEKILAQKRKARRP